MEKIEAGALKDAMNFLKGLSDKLFKYLSSSDHKVEKVKDIGNGWQQMTLKYKGKLPIYIETKQVDDDLYDMVIKVADIADKSEKYKRVHPDDMQDKIDDACKKLIDDDLKKSFGITSSKELRISLQRVVSAKEVDIRLCGITANYDFGEATAVLDTLLESDEFIESIPEEVTSYSIIDEGEELDISSLDEAMAEDELILDSLYQMLCAAVKFNMEAQVFHWDSAFNEHLFSITGDLLYMSQTDVNQIGLWIVQNCNSVVSPYGVQSGMWFEDCDLTSPHSPQIESIGTGKIFDAIDAYVDTLNFFYPNFSHDMQFEIDRMIRGLKEISDFRLKQYC